MILSSIPYDAGRFGLPAMVVNLSLVHPAFPNRVELCDGLLDTGASLSTIPRTKKDALGLNQRGTVWVGGYEGPRREVPAYYVNFSVSSSNDSDIKLDFKDIKVIATDRDYSLVGRNIVNRLKLFADGQSRVFTLEDS
jgi:hypothetical protein